MLSDEFNHESGWELTELPEHKVGASREEKCSFMGSCEVWAEVPVVGCWQCSGRRLAKRSLSKRSTWRGCVLRCHSPLEALRLLLSHVATNRDGRHGGRNVTVLDAKMARLHAFAESEVFVELPPERWKPGFCGSARASMARATQTPSGSAFLRLSLRQCLSSAGKPTHASSATGQGTSS